MRPAAAEKNSLPADPLDSLQRLLNCSREQLAERLGWSRHKLMRVRKDGTTPEQAQELADFLSRTMADAGHGWLAGLPWRAGEQRQAQIDADAIEARQVRPQGVAQPGSTASLEGSTWQRV